MMRISAITLDTLLELVEGRVIHELGEDSLSGIHPSLSAIRAACGHSEPAPGLAAVNSNRKMRVTHYRICYVLVMTGDLILAGHY